VKHFTMIVIRDVLKLLVS